MPDDALLDPELRAVALRYFAAAETSPVPTSLTVAHPSLERDRGFGVGRGLATVAVFAAMCVALTVVVVVGRNVRDEMDGIVSSIWRTGERGVGDGIRHRVPLPGHVRRLAFGPLEPDVGLCRRQLERGDDQRRNAASSTRCDGDGMGRCESNDRPVRWRGSARKCQ